MARWRRATLPSYPGRATGKEIIADAIHAHSHAAAPGEGELCRPIETLRERLFGHVAVHRRDSLRPRALQAGGERDDLPDEVGSMSLTGQAKLLRVLQEHEFEPVAPGDRPRRCAGGRRHQRRLAKAVAVAGSARICSSPQRVSHRAAVPLRDRGRHRPLAQHFDRHTRALGKPIRGSDPTPSGPGRSRLARQRAN